MAEKNIAVFGIFPHRASFEYAFGVLKGEGFRDTDISVLLQENQGTKDLATQEGNESAGRCGHWRRLGSGYRRRAWLVGRNWRAIFSHPRAIDRSRTHYCDSGGNWSRRNAGRGFRSIGWAGNA